MYVLEKLLLQSTMHPSVVQFFVLLIAAAFCSFSLVTRALHEPQPANGVSAGCIPKERDALLAFKQGITEDPTGLLDSWRRDGGHDEQDCCWWRGVWCSNRTGHVLKLRLGNELAGNYKYPDTALVGQISHSLLALEDLNHLDLSYNELEGSTGRIPEFLGSLKSLEYLNLSGIYFVGNVPPQLGNLSNLQYLDLSNDMGDTNSTDVSWLMRLSFLEHLDLSWVNLSTVADWPHVVNMVPSLRVLRLSVCSLTSANQSLLHLNLTNLEVLSLSGNDFDHPFVSGWFWNLTSLKYLDLGSTRMYGRLPDALGDMTSLQFLDLSCYSLESKSIAVPNLNNLCSLEILSLDYSLLYADTTELFKSLPHCSPNKLQELYLDNNNISGPLPTSISHFASLRILDLSLNHLTGYLPYEIGILTNLTYLDLSDNHLDGIITEEHFDGLKSLRYIDLSTNSLKIEISSKWQPPFRLKQAGFSSCQMGPLFPAWLQWLVDIVYLDISSTGINDRIPHWFSSSFSNARSLYISNNKLNGGLPEDMEIMALKRLDLSSNKLTGQIQPLPRDLIYLDISMNSLSGPLPANFGVPKLHRLFLFSNRITGRVPESICGCEGLQILDIADNLFEGELPMCFGKRVIISLVLSNNNFSGKFPSFIKNCTTLQVLDLAGNMFSGRLPMWIGNFVTLKFLRLSHNMFSGNIPINITNLECLQYIDIADNGISGYLPGDLLYLKALRLKYPTVFCSDDADTEFYSPSLSTVVKGQQLNYGSIYKIIQMDMKTIDLSINNLTGGIPEELATLGELVNLNLSRNHFSGIVPSNIGDMQSLQSLDLSRNLLSGEIPAGFTNLTFLSYLDLSYNNLTGRIPSGSQLDTLYDEHPSMYAGNIGLCGPPLKKNCSGTDASKQDHFTRTEYGPGPDFFYLGLTCGIIAGIWVVFFTLLFKKQWRIAYVRLFDKLHDKAYVLVVVTWARLMRKTTAN